MLYVYDFHEIIEDNLEAIELLMRYPENTFSLLTPVLDPLVVNAVKLVKLTARPGNITYEEAAKEVGIDEHLAFEISMSIEAALIRREVRQNKKSNNKQRKGFAKSGKLK